MLRTKYSCVTLMMMFSFDTLAMISKTNNPLDGLRMPQVHLSDHRSQSNVSAGKNMIEIAIGRS
jgi:hypothetical protein